MGSIFCLVCLAQHSKKCYTSLKGKNLLYIISLCLHIAIFLSPFLLLSLSVLYLLPLADYALSSHFTIPLESGIFFPFLHYFIFHSDSYFCCAPFLLILLHHSCITYFQFSHCKPDNNLLTFLRTFTPLSVSHLSHCNYLPLQLHSQLLNQNMPWSLQNSQEVSTFLLFSQGRKPKFFPSGILAPDQPMHSVCSSHTDTGARQ